MLSLLLLLLLLLSLSLSGWPFWTCEGKRPRPVMHLRSFSLQLSSRGCLKVVAGRPWDKWQKLSPTGLVFKTLHNPKSLCPTCLWENWDCWHLRPACHPKPLCALCIKYEISSWYLDYPELVFLEPLIKGINDDKRQRNRSKGPAPFSGKKVFTFKKRPLRSFM